MGIKVKVTAPRIVVVLGSGATAGSGYSILRQDNTSAAPPVDRTFWEEVDRLHSGRNVTTPALDYLRKTLYLESPRQGMEEVWNLISVHRKYAGQNHVRYSDKERERLSNTDENQWMKPWLAQNFNVEHAVARQAEYDLKKLLALVFGRNVLLRESGDGKPPKNAYEMLFGSLGLNEQKNSARTSFLTFNYDCTLELSLTEREIDFFYPNFTTLPSHGGSIPITKLHGSLNWQHGIDGYVRPRLRYSNRVFEKAQIINSILDPGEVADFRQATTAKGIDCWIPMVIPPVLFKEELFFQTGQDRVRTHFDHIWSVAVEAVREAALFIFIGYSFPDADPHARWLFKMRDEESRALFVDIPDAKHQKERLERIFGPNTHFCYCSFQGSAACMGSWMTNPGRDVCPSA